MSSPSCRSVSSKPASILSDSPRSQRTKAKIRQGMMRASSSLKIKSGLESFSSFEDSDGTQCPGTNAAVSPDLTNNGEHFPDPPSAANDNEANTRKSPQEHPRMPEPRPCLQSRSLLQPDTASKHGVDSEMSSAKTFYSGIHQGYNIACGELNALFGEVRLESMSSGTRRENAQVELLQMLAITTKDRHTYKASIRQAFQICQDMEDRIVAERLWKKTAHITCEMEEEFGEHEQQSPAGSNDGRAPLTTTTEEDEDHSDHPDDSYAAPSMPHNPSATIHNDHSTRPRRTSPNVRQPDFFTGNNGSKEAHDQYVRMLHADVARRQEATDRFIANLEDDLAQRKHATDMYIAELEAKVRNLD
ncbi:hypothetical protein IWZ00DRAFT_380105 [Phyllosticta capitalensis]|uniref:Uncharacterized protein n=1 Tax=Phyllosticta capitalensis TaxID=121624 RepID=A0ABR1YES3_9PEZI